MASPPSFAPSSRWIAIMDGLPDDFGEDASLDPDLVSRIRAYLTMNAAESGHARRARACAREPTRSASPDRGALLDSHASGEPGGGLHVQGGRRKGRLQRLSQRRFDRSLRSAKDPYSGASFAMRATLHRGVWLVVAASAFALRRPGQIAETAPGFLCKRGESVRSRIRRVFRRARRASFPDQFLDRQARHAILHDLSHDRPNKDRPNPRRQGH